MTVAELKTKLDVLAVPDHYTVTLKAIAGGQVLVLGAESATRCDVLTFLVQGEVK